MKRFFLLSLLIMLSFASSVSAIDPNAMAPAEWEMIVNNCEPAQRTLQSIQHVDPVTRLNRGNAYDTVAKLMSALASRVAANSLNVPKLASATSNLQTLRAKFSKDYTAYEIELRNLVLLDCKNHPEDFYRNLISVRARRADLVSDIKAMDGQLDVFQQGTDELKIQLGSR